jgi:hypothetical protein
LFDFWFLVPATTIPSLSPILHFYVYILLMPSNMHGLRHSMLPLFSLVLSIPILEFFIQPSSSLAPYFLWLVLKKLH